MPLIPNSRSVELREGYHLNRTAVFLERTPAFRLVKVIPTGHVESLQRPRRDKRTLFDWRLRRALASRSPHPLASAASTSVNTTSIGLAADPHRSAVFSRRRAFVASSMVTRYSHRPISPISTARTLAEKCRRAFEMLSSPSRIVPHLGRAAMAAAHFSTTVLALAAAKHWL